MGPTPAPTSCGAPTGIRLACVTPTLLVAFSTTKYEPFGSPVVSKLPIVPDPVVVATIAVIVGHRAGRLLNPDLTRKIAALLFAVAGVLLITGVL